MEKERQLYYTVDMSEDGDHILGKLEDAAARSQHVIQGDCPLPEFTGDEHSAPPVEHPDVMSIRRQPRDKDFDYDIEQNMKEHMRFVRTVENSVKRGEMTREDADKLLSAMQPPKQK